MLLTKGRDEYRAKVKAIMNKDKQPFVRSVLGIGAEAGEVQDTVKKYLRGDITKLQMKVDSAIELGDLLFYMEFFMSKLELTFEDIMDISKVKLDSRDKFRESSKAEDKLEADALVYLYAKDKLSEDWDTEL